jgi:hypothetical protein
MDSIYLFNLCTKKEYFSYRVFLFIVVDTESKKESIAFIYIFVLTQNLGEMGSILFIVVDIKKKKESIAFICLIYVHKKNTSVIECFY